MKKALSLLLVLAMVLSMVPAVFAEETVDTVNALNEVSVDAAGTYNYQWTAPGNGEVVVELWAVAADNTTVTFVDQYGTEQNIEWTVDVPVADNNEGPTDIFEELQCIGELTLYVYQDDVYTITLVSEGSAKLVADESVLVKNGASADYPIDLTADLMYEGDSSATVTVPAGWTVYYQSYNLTGMNMSINGGEAIAVAGNPRVAYAWSIANDGETDAEYVITVAYPLGNQGNPATLVIGDNTASIEAGSQGYYYTWTATEDGTLSITMPSDIGWAYAFSNVTAGTYGDTQWSDSDPVVNPGTIEVAAGDVIEIMVNTYDPANMWANPAGTLTITAAFEAAAPAAVYSFAATGGIAPFLSLEDEVFLMVGFDMYQDGVKLTADTITEDILANFGVAVWSVDNKPEDANCTVENADYCLGDAYWHTSNNRITVRTAGIPAKNMGDAIAFRPFYKNADGTYTYGRIIASYSPRTYAESNANKSSNAEAFRALMVALMNYGAAAQEYFGYKTDDLMNSAWTDEQKATTWDESWVRSSYPTDKADASWVRDSSKITSRTANLTLEGAITVNLYAKVSFDVKSATAYYWTEDTYNSVEALTLENASASAPAVFDDQSRWVAGYDGVAAKDLFNTVYSMIVFEDTDGNVYYTGVVAYSAERFAYTNRNGTTTSAELARRLACYSKAAQAYFFG